MPWIIPAIIISYLTGSIPTAYIFGRVIKGADIRKFGSGNVGATNALRLLGKGWGITVLAIDILKGVFSVTVLGSIFCGPVCIHQETFRILLGIGCICGHNWPVFLKFKGGKGVATSLGVLLGLSFKIAGLNLVLGLTVLIWFAVFILSRIISLASVLAALSFPFLAIYFKQPVALISVGILLSLFIILRHKSNIQRILKGKEPKLSLKK